MKFKDLIKITLIWTLAVFIIACDDDEPNCGLTSCPPNYAVNSEACACECVLTESSCGTNEALNSTNCLCEVVAGPCESTNCPTGTIKQENGANCDCVDDPNLFDDVTESGFISGNVTWEKKDIHILSGKVVVSDGAVLTIEAGTVIKGVSGTGTLASALIVAQGGKIMAVGTESAPIIFTSVSDQITPKTVEESGPVSPNLDESDNALWGGLIVLGKAPISAADGDNVAQIEGIPADDTFGRYGGSIADDDSGIIKYVSVRHGGALIGADNEINGITFGGVGNTTVVENIEVVANLDDGVEFFGGTVNVKNVVVANGEDDGIDIDQNYSGTITNAFVIQSGATAGDNGLEIDGPEGTLTDGLFTINGVTLIDEDGGADTAGDLKSKAQGTITNASWRGYTDEVHVRASFTNDCASESGDSYLNFANDLLQITDSEWVGTATISDWTDAYVDKGDVDAAGAICPEPASYDTTLDAKMSDAARNNSINAAAMKGADPAPFSGWSWSAAKNKLN